MDNRKRKVQNAGANVCWVHAGRECVIATWGFRENTVFQFDSFAYFHKSTQGDRDFSCAVSGFG